MFLLRFCNQPIIIYWIWFIWFFFSISW